MPQAVYPHNLGEILYRSKKSGFFALAGRVVVEEGRFLGFLLGVFCVCGWFWV